MFRDGDDNPEFLQEQAEMWFEREMVDLACLLADPDTYARLKTT
jgi:hypothetical protein